MKFCVTTPISKASQYNQHAKNIPNNPTYINSILKNCLESFASTIGIQIGLSDPRLMAI